MGWLILIVIVFTIVLVCVKNGETNEENERLEKLRKECEQKFEEKYGCTQAELKRRICTSPAVDKIAKTIKEEAPEKVNIYCEGVSFGRNLIRFKDMGLSDLPNEGGRVYWDFRIILAELLKEKCHARNIWSPDSESVIVLKFDPKPDTTDHTIEGW